MITITKNTNVAQVSQTNSFMDPYNIDWATMPVGMRLDVGPFTIEADIHIDQQSIIDSYFFVKVSVKIPFVGEVQVLNGRIDKNNTKIDASILGVGAALVFDINKLELYADLHAFGYSYHVTIWKL